MTELHDAVINNKIRKVRKLLNNGADIHKKDDYGTTALHEAEWCGYVNIAELLIEKGAY